MWLVLDAQDVAVRERCLGRGGICGVDGDAVVIEQAANAGA
jgi:hypothetical protein